MDFQDISVLTFCASVGRLICKLFSLFARSRSKFSSWQREACLQPQCLFKKAVIQAWPGTLTVQQIVGFDRALEMSLINCKLFIADNILMSDIAWPCRLQVGHSRRKSHFETEVQ